MQTPTLPRPYAALPLLWAAVVLVLTLTPSAEMPRTPDWELLSFDTAGHAGVFALQAALSYFSLRRQRRWPWLARHAGAAVLAGCVLFGGLIEVLQYAMHAGRHAEWTDLLADTIGAALALLVMRGGFRWWQARRVALVVLVGFGLTMPARAQDVDLARARRTIEALAAPKMHGRGYVKNGEHIAAAYLRRRLQQLGLQPLVADYTQPFGLEVNTFPGTFTCTFRSIVFSEPGSTFCCPKKLLPGVNIIALPGSSSASFENIEAYRLDSLDLDTPAHKEEWLESTRSTPAKRRAVVLSTWTQKSFDELTPTVRQIIDSSAVVINLTKKLTASIADKQDTQCQLAILDDGSVFKHKFYAALQALSLHLDAQLVRNYQTQNLAALVRGRTQPDSFLVVTAHYDHLGMMGKATYFPGANDNASGVALLLELAAHYARPENQPACSVVFLLFGAEEAGLVGSGYFVQHPLIPLKSIKFLFNLDLLGTGEEGATVVNGRTLPAAFQRLTALNDAHRYLPHLAARGPAANSDHYPFSQAGVPAFFLYTRGGSKAYHDVNDQPAALSLAGFAGAYGLVRDFLDASGARP